MEHFHIVVHRDWWCIMFLWLCAVIALVSAENLENDEISQRLGDILRGSSESDDQKMDGHWYQIANFQVNEDQNECKHLIITENITKFLDENCKETLAQFTSQKNEFRLIKTSSGEFLAAMNKNKEQQTESLALYGSNVDTKQLQLQLPKSLGDLLLKPCDKIYKDCMRKVRNTKEKCDNMKKSFRKADSQAQMDYMDDYFTICTMNNTDYISYDDVLIPIEPSIKDSDKESQQTLIANKTAKDANPERSPQEGAKEFADDLSLSENDKIENQKNISLDKDQDEDSAKAKMNDTSERFDKITSNRPPREYIQELADDPSLSEIDETASHKNISLSNDEDNNSTNFKLNDTSERFEKITNNKLEVSNITNDSTVSVDARIFDLWDRGSQNSPLDEKNEEDESDFFNSGGSNELSAKYVTNSLDGLLNKVNSIVEKAKALSNLAREKVYNANKNSVDSELKKNIVPPKNPAAKVRENNAQNRKAARDYLFVTTPHNTNNGNRIQLQNSIFYDTNDEGSGDYLFPGPSDPQDRSQNPAASTDSSLFEKYSKFYDSFHNSNTKGSVVSSTTKIVEKQDLTQDKANENNANKNDSSATKLPYDDFGEYLPTISHSSNDDNDNQNISDLENATPFEFDITGDTIITRNFNGFNMTNTTYNNGTYNVTGIPTTQIPDVHHSSSMSPIINPTVIVVIMLINFLNDG